MLRFSFLLAGCWVLLTAVGPVDSFANNNDPLVIVCDPPPAPTNFQITSTTPTSIALSWSAPGASVYNIATQDLTVPTSIPDANGSGNSTTISGLQPGHTYQFTLKVATPAAPTCWSNTVNKNGQTSIVIVDIMAGLQSPCTPSGGASKASGTTETLCINRFNNMTSNVATVKVTINGHVAYFNVVFDDSNQTQEPVLKIELVSHPAFASTGYDIIPAEAGKASLTYAGSEVLALEGSVYTDLYGELILSFLKQTTLATCRTGCPSDRSDETGTGGVLKNSLSLAPNPFANNTTLNYQLEQTTVVQIQVFDAMGRLVQTPQPTATLPEGPQTAIVDGAGLPNGVYFVVLQTDGKRQVQRLVKQD